ncbi:hypothetical protein [Nonomuraea typhae]|uniref:Uncharacterized protein n=1 Tax=Nonomuraea typhae TaxID=2603600 RepID=A0ABW7YLR4_9ACTN
MSEPLEFKDVDAVLTPPEAERYLKQVNNALAHAQKALRRLRYQELAVERAYIEGRTRLVLSPDCPKVGRAEGCVTVEERDLWINDRISEQYWTYRSLQVQTRNAEDYLKAVSKQASIAQSINSNAREIYSTSGGGR